MCVAIAALGMTAAQTFMAGTTIAAAATSAYAANQQGRAAQQTAEYNYKMADLAAKDAERRGEEEAIKVRQKGDQLKGAMRARMAANGLDLGVGTAADLQDQADFFKETDVGTTRQNARQAAWNARANGNAQLAQGNFAAQNSNLQGFGTLLGAAGQVASKWGNYGK